MWLCYETIGGTPEEAAARIKSDVVRWTKIIHDAGIESQQLQIDRSSEWIKISKPMRRR
jgi:hypothetical protein